VQARHQSELQQELVMQKIWKQAIGAVSLSAMAIVATTAANAWEDPKGGQHFDKGRPVSKEKPKDPPQNAQRNKSDTIKPNPNSGTADDPCKRPGTQCDPRDGGASGEATSPGGPKAGASGPEGSPSAERRRRKDKSDLIIVMTATSLVAGAVAGATGGKNKPVSP
jgi:hypothetical protein